jgi:hypothetical protein
MSAARRAATFAPLSTGTESVVNGGSQWTCCYSHAETLTVFYEQFLYAPWGYMLAFRNTLAHERHPRQGGRVRLTGYSKTFVPARPN